MNKMDQVLQKALSPAISPSEELNNKILNQIKSKGCDEMHLRNKKLIMAAIAAVCILIVPTSAYAAYQYLLPKEAAKEMDDKKLEEAFDQVGTEVMQAVTDGSYKITYLGHVTGEDLSERTGSAWELHPDRIYVAVAIEKADGTVIQNEDGNKLFVSPLIQGLTPWEYNIVTMNGSYMEKIIDGVLYRIIECDNIEVFADKKLYLAISDTAFFSKSAYQYEEATGDITAAEDYKGTNALFDLILDPSKADAIKAKEYLKQLEQEWNSASTIEDKESNPVERDNDASTDTNLRIQQELFTDEENGITIRIKDNDSHSWSGNEEYSQTILSYYLEVEGDNIEALTYTLNQGEFSNRPEHRASATEYYGKECSLSYEEQKDRNYHYSISFKGYYKDYGYDIQKVDELGQKEIDARDRIYYEVLDKAISDTEMSLELKLKDGRTLNKILTFKNVLDQQGFWIAISVE